MTCEEKTFTVTISYNMFAPGERVRPGSARCPLDAGTYIVRECRPPTSHADEDSVVFLEGHPYGVSGRFLAPAE